MSAAIFWTAYALALIGLGVWSWRLVKTAKRRDAATVERERQP